MIKHFAKEDLPKLSKRKPFLLFHCELNGMGVPGLLLGLWPNNECYIANERLCDNPEYNEFYNEILSYIPEFISVAGRGTQINKKREEYNNTNSSAVYLGTGNHARVYTEFKCMVKDWDNIHSIMGHIDKYVNNEKVDIYQMSLIRDNR